MNIIGIGERVGGQGATMPKGGNLETKQLETISGWIEEGANP